MRSPKAYPQAVGNCSILLLVDSSQKEHRFVATSTASAMLHFGLPMRVLDVAHASLDDKVLRDCAAVVIAQEHLGASMSTRHLGSLLNAVKDGLGVVNFDSNIASYGSVWAEALGLHPARPRTDFVTSGTIAVNVTDRDHPITWMQDGGTRKSFKLPVPVTLVRGAANDLRTLLEDDHGFPMLVARRFGKGRIVQWLVSPRVWLPQYFGHTFGLDDVWLRSVLWATRKPFVFTPMPPFVRLRVDDCRGLWQEAGDFRFVDALNERGHVPTLCLCLRAVKPSGVRKLQALYSERKVELAPHTVEPGVSLYYGGAGGEYSRAQLAELLSESDRFFRDLGRRASAIVSDHDHALSWNAVPALVARQMTYKMNITLPGEQWDDVHVDWHPAPYGSMDYAFDFLPAPADAFFVVHNHYPPAFSASRAYLDCDHFLYHRSGGYGPYKWDFLDGLTKSADDGTNVVEEMAQRLAAHTRSGLDAMFFGGSITHSHSARFLSPGEWGEVLARADQLMPRHHYELVGYDAIAAYAESKCRTNIVEAQRRPGTVRVGLEGTSRVRLRIYACRDDDFEDCGYEEIEPFVGASGLEVKG